MKFTVIAIVLFSFSHYCKAQNTPDSSLKNISVQKDVRLDLLVKKSRDINEEIYYKTTRNLAGFRLQVINTNDRNKALEIKSKLLSDFPDEKTYLIYHSPYFKIQMGNFRTREDAEKLMKKVKAIYPSGVFIVPSRVEIKPTKDGDIIL
ncbi:MAG: SPOR domain-containing protein [Agriterribacter sp.]